jgi:hypothetical protein
MCRRERAVARKHIGLHEVRTRVMCNLPVNHRNEEKAFFTVLDYLNELRHQGIGVSGYTHSVLRPSAFLGYWWPETATEPVRDRIVLCTIDFLLDVNSPELSLQVTRLKQAIRKWYRHHSSPQDEIWVVAHPILRQD